MKQHLLWGGALLLVTIATYLPALGCGFIWDDDAYVTENVTLRSADGLRRIWLEPRSIPQYYPLVHTTFWLEYRLWGLEPFGYHLVNVLLHAANAVLVWRLLALLGMPGAWLAAAVFAVHPVHVESVAWVTERKNLLSGAFYLAAMRAYLRFSPADAAYPPRPESWKPYLLSCALFLAALLSKSVTATLPAVLLVIYWWKRGRIDWGEVRRLLPFFLVGIALGLHTSYLERQHVGAHGAAWDLSWVDRCLIAGRAVWFYAAKLLWPHPLNFIYPRWQIDSAAWWQYLFPLSALMLLLVLWRMRRQIGRGPLSALLIFGGTLFPALGFVDVYPMRFSFVADHFQYLASIAIIALVVAGVAAGLREKRWMRLRVAGSCALLVVLGGLSIRQESAYRNAATLWANTLRKNPDCWLAHYNLGYLAFRQDRFTEAETGYRRALRLDPDNADIHNNLGSALARQNRLEAAAAAYREAVRLRPSFARAYDNLGLVYGRQGKLDEAVSAIQRAIEIAPDAAQPRNNLGGLLARQGRLEEAVEQFAHAVRLDPSFEDAKRNLERAKSMLAGGEATN